MVNDLHYEFQKMVVIGVNISPTVEVIRRFGLGFKSYTWHSLEKPGVEFVTPDLEVKRGFLEDI